jgi:hypothetical protein
MEHIMDPMERRLRCATPARWVIKEKIVAMHELAARTILPISKGR